jgi:hypothetical protein
LERRGRWAKRTREKADTRSRHEKQTREADTRRSGREKRTREAELEEKLAPGEEEKFHFPCLCFDLKMKFKKFCEKYLC